MAEPQAGMLCNLFEAGWYSILAPARCGLLLQRFLRHFIRAPAEFLSRLSLPGSKQDSRSREEMMQSCAAAQAQQKISKPVLIVLWKQLENVLKAKTNNTAARFLGVISCETARLQLGRRMSAQPESTSCCSLSALRRWVTSRKGSSLT